MMGGWWSGTLKVVQHSGGDSDAFASVGKLQSRYGAALEVDNVLVTLVGVLRLPARCVCGREHGELYGLARRLDLIDADGADYRASGCADVCAGALLFLPLDSALVTPLYVTKERRSVLPSTGPMRSGDCAVLHRFLHPRFV